MRTQIFINGLLGNLKQVCGAQLSYSYLAGQVKHRAAFPRMYQGVSFRAERRDSAASRILRDAFAFRGLRPRHVAKPRNPSVNCSSIFCLISRAKHARNLFAPAASRAALVAQALARVFTGKKEVPGRLGAAFLSPNQPLTTASHLWYTYFCRNRRVYPERFSRRVPPLGRQRDCNRSGREKGKVRWFLAASKRNTGTRVSLRPPLRFRPSTLNSFLFTFL